MDLPNIKGLILMPSASENEILKVENEMIAKLPNSYKDLLKTSNGLSSEEGVRIYGTEDIIERNEIWQTQIYAKGYIAIGDDGGGQVFLMFQGDDEKEVLIVDAGDMTPEHSVLVTSNLTLWVNNGFKINTDEIQEVRSWADGCKIVLIDTPNGGLKDLLKIKDVFGLNITANELLKGSRNLPFILVDEFPYEKALKLVEELKDIKIELKTKN
ncbi:SMI1/KNR4 family protein [Bacillus sp. 165]|uniref:SMI1/KNR4 family protein n=1 Tax=Bacillus sp. 165 TaxID=1529117 RepID=UPI001AD9A69F|nr:SMI1/KNR4 family protein [Bacillus sp. 165]MBO9128412.1 SMI1/KNR4 family protein [Bacillus sp. 165]